jgi:hypothetical protein
MNLRGLNSDGRPLFVDTTRLIRERAAAEPTAAESVGPAPA